MQKSIMLPDKYKKQAPGTCRLWWHTKLCCSARGGSLCGVLVAPTCLETGDVQTEQEEHQDPHHAIKIILIPSFFLLHPPCMIHCEQATPVISGGGGHAAQTKKTFWQSSRYRNPAFVCHMDLKVHFAREEAGSESSVLLNLQRQLIYGENSTQSVSLFGLQ